MISIYWDGAALDRSLKRRTKGMERGLCTEGDNRADGERLRTQTETNY